MMRKYNKPEIVTLALDTVDVIETSGTRMGQQALAEKGYTAQVATIEEHITNMSDGWNW